MEARELFESKGTTINVIDLMEEFSKIKCAEVLEALTSEKSKYSIMYGGQPKRIAILSESDNVECLTIEEFINLNLK